MVISNAEIIAALAAAMNMISFRLIFIEEAPAQKNVLVMNPWCNPKDGRGVRPVRRS